MKTLLNILSAFKINCTPDPFKDKVKCEVCKCWVDKADAQRVDSFGLLTLPPHYYCQAHRRPYDQMVISHLGGQYHFYKTIPAHEIEVTKEGKEIKEK